MLRLYPTAFLLVAVLPALAGTSSRAQSPSESTLILTVVDPTGAKIPRADVDLSNDTISRSATTDGYGRVAFTVAPGEYDLSVDADGFKTLNRKVRIEARALDLTLRLAIETQMVELNVPSDDANDPTSRSGLVLKGEKLEILSDDDDTFQKEVIALAGGNGPHGAQIFVDGFSGGTFPPKSAIREVRVNGNAYSAEFDKFGLGVVQIFTKPGGSQMHGQLQVTGNDAPFNARNPYTGLEPPYYTLNLDGSISGPLTKRASFFLGGSYNDLRNNMVVNAQILDAATLLPLAYSAATPNPTTVQRWTPRIDVPVTRSNTLIARYDFTQTNLGNGSVGLLVLPEQGYASGTTAQTLQLSDTQSIGLKAILEGRFQYRRLRTQQSPNSAAPTLVVESAFNGGGNPQQVFNDNQDSYELQEYLNLERGKHFLRIGGRGRVYRESNYATANYNGQFVFNSLAAYQITLQGIRNGETGPQIRAQGGGASQFSITTGQASASITTADLGLFVDDDWKLRDNLTLSLGLRFESQTAVPDHFDPAPRLGFSWGVGQTAKRDPIVTVSGGTGLFYDRFPAVDLLTTVRQNGVRQQSYFFANPDTYPNAPTLSATPPTLYSLDPNLRSEYDFDADVAVNRSLSQIALGKHVKIPLNGTITLDYIYNHGVHQWLSRNLNAPLANGTTPNGTSQALYQFASQGVTYTHTLSVTLNLQPTRRITLLFSGNFQRLRADALSITGFPSNPYDLAQDYGREPNAEDQIFTGARLQLPFGITSSSFLSAQSGQRFNITTGTDLNGDTIYNDRPAFATDLTRPSVVQTPYGNFDTRPIAGQQIIPINYGQAPRFLYLNTSLSRSWRFGPVPPMPAGSKNRPPPPYRLSFQLLAANVLNNVNPGLPNGVIGQDPKTNQPSTNFGRSLSLSNVFGGNLAANRIVTLRTSFTF